MMLNVRHACRKSTALLRRYKKSDQDPISVYVKRRSILKFSVAVIAVWINGLFAWRNKVSAEEVATYNDEEIKRWLESVVDTVVPPDEQPGAVEAGVAAQLEDRLKINDWRRDLYQHGRNILDQLATERYGTVFSKLGLRFREELLISLSEGQASEKRRDRLFFQTLRRDVMRRYYSSPIGQRAIGYRPPKNGYRN